ncbi:hypothetical protein RSJ19_04600 [Clostridium botulinum]|nr:hypothetical protein RSJ19_04600 [Clostridium botulinum]
MRIYNVLPFISFLAFMGKQILESNKKGDDIVSNIKISKKIFIICIFFEYKPKKYTSKNKF